eukprot:6214721-Pleurochrysis_carterae.AAC.2
MDSAAVRNGTHEQRVFQILWSASWQQYPPSSGSAHAKEVVHPSAAGVEYDAAQHARYCTLIASCALGAVALAAGRCCTGSAETAGARQRQMVLSGAVQQQKAAWSAAELASGSIAGKVLLLEHKASGAGAGAAAQVHAANTDLLSLDSGCAPVPRRASARATARYLRQTGAAGSPGAVALSERAHPTRAAAQSLLQQQL